jgi:hypothetical protein
MKTAFLVRDLGRLGLAMVLIGAVNGCREAPPPRIDFNSLSLEEKFEEARKIQWPGERDEVFEKLCTEAYTLSKPDVVEKYLDQISGPGQRDRAIFTLMRGYMSLNNKEKAKALLEKLSTDQARESAMQIIHSTPSSAQMAP